MPWVWLFILAAAAFDLAFACRHAATLAAWELNPFMRSLALHGGLLAVAGYKLASLALLGLALRAADRAWTRWAGWILAVAHGLMLLAYVPLLSW